MDFLELKERLYWSNTPSSFYSLEDGLEYEAFYLLNKDGFVEFYYLDEKGDKQDHRIFTIAEEAYDFFWNIIETELRFFKIKPRNKEK